MEIVTQKHFLVYKITNKTNGKTYIGCHKTEDVNDKYMSSGKIIKRAISKNGIENFNKEILFDFDNSVEMFAKEKQLIETLEPEYNLHEGGSGGFEYLNRNGLNTSQKRLDSMKRVGLRRSAEAKKRYALNPKLCRECSSAIEYRKRKENVFCDRKCSGRYNALRRVHSEETKLKISISLRKRNMD